MKLKNFLIKLICVLLIAGCLFYYQSVATTRAAEVEKNNQAIAEVEAYNREVLRSMNQGEELKDGTYSGEATGYGGPIQLTVTVKDGKIEAIDVSSHDGEDPAYYSQAVKVLDDIISAQDPEVDTISGATFSSLGLIGAVQNALEKAVEK